jgi:hypothetical protein
MRHHLSPLTLTLTLKKTIGFFVFYGHLFFLFPTNLIYRAVLKQCYSPNHKCSVLKEFN